MTDVFIPKNADHLPLFKPLAIGENTARNRIIMAPLTRSRSTAKSNTQTALHAEYYGQRASGGLIISEATQISQQGQGYAWTPGIFTQEQVDSWKPVTDAVHAEGGLIFCQLWHVGAISHPVFQPEGGQPVSASAWTPRGKAFVGDRHEDGPQVFFEEARALRSEEIPAVIEDYRHAARCAIAAGFDGVEVHAANNYLIDQFIRTATNNRDDDYGGSLEDRLRLLDEVVAAVCDEIHPQRVGVRLSPTGGAGGGRSDDNPAETYPAAAGLLAKRNLAYLHVIRPNSHTGGGDSDEGEQILWDMRTNFDGVFIANGNFTPEEAGQWISAGRADAIAFGRMFLANPDLPQRIAQDGPYNEPDEDTFYGGGAEGYTDYPALDEVKRTIPA